MPSPYAMRPNGEVNSPLHGLGSPPRWGLCLWRDGRGLQKQRDVGFRLDSRGVVEGRIAVRRRHGQLNLLATGLRHADRQARLQ